MSLFKKDETGNVIKPYVQMTEIDKREFMLHELEHRKGALMLNLQELDKLMAEKAMELEELREERERIAQQSVSTIACADDIRQRIADLKQVKD